MPVSQTTFEQRLAKIDKSGAKRAQAGRRARGQRSIRARLLTFPALVGVSILTGGTAYAFSATQTGRANVALDLPAVISNIEWVMALVS